MQRRKSPDGAEEPDAIWSVRDIEDTRIVEECGVEITRLKPGQRIKTLTARPKARKKIYNAG